MIKPRTSVAMTGDGMETEPRRDSNTPTAPSAGVLIDICDERKRRMFRPGVVIFAIFVGLPLCCIVGAAAVAGSVVAIVVIAIVVGVGMMVVRSMRQDRLRIIRSALIDALQKHERNPRDALNAVLPTVEPGQTPLLLSEYMRQAREAGWQDLTVRIQPDVSTKIVPIRVPFEPVPIGNITGTLFEKEYEPDSIADRSSSDTIAPDKRPRHKPRSRRVLSYILTILFYSYVAFRIIQQIIDWISTGVPPRSAYTWGLAFVVLLCLRLSMRLYQEHAVLLVPSGLVLRKSRWHDSHWSLHIFDRRRSLLTAYQFSETVWTISVADGEKTHEFRADDHITRCVLRAWLSPLETPSAEQLGELQ